MITDDGEQLRPSACALLPRLSVQNLSFLHRLMAESAMSPGFLSGQTLLFMHALGPRYA